MSFTSVDRRLLNGLRDAMMSMLRWKPTVDAEISRVKTTEATNNAKAMEEVARVERSMDLPNLAKREDIDGIIQSIGNLQDDLSSTKLSVLVQTCSDLGTQSGDLRLYTQEECDAMHGEYSSSGECSKKFGGSFSYDCGKLLKGAEVVSKKRNSFFNVFNSSTEIVPKTPVPAASRPMPFSKMPVPVSKMPVSASNVNSSFFSGGRLRSKTYKRKQSKRKLRKTRK